MSKEIFVYECFSFDEPILMGTLLVNQKGGENFAFAYDEDYLANKDVIKFSIDPELSFYRGYQYSEKGFFGIFEDTLPDRYGRKLILDEEQLLAEKEGRRPKTLGKTDFLLRLSDFSRTGGLRYKERKDGPFLSEERNIPPLERIASLENASLIYESGDEGREEAIKMLLSPASSLGGARPKANTLDTSGNLYIAKFPSRKDEYDVEAFEKLTQDLAKASGLSVAPSFLKRFSKYGSTFLLKRFDRDNDKRILLISAMTLLRKKDGEEASYLELADLVRAKCRDNGKSLRELFLRIAFSCLVGNEDDHLRNHAFLLTRKGFELSPLFDVNPTIYGNRLLTLSIDDEDRRMNIPLLISLARYFELGEEEAKDLIEKMKTTISSLYYPLGKKLLIPKSELDMMKPSFALAFE